MDKKEIKKIKKRILEQVYPEAKDYVKEDLDRLIKGVGRSQSDN